MKSSIIFTIYILWAFGFLNFFSAIIWSISKPSDHWIWFSRSIAGLILIGFGSLIAVIQEKNDKE